MEGIHRSASRESASGDPSPKRTLAGPADAGRVGGGKTAAGETPGKDLSPSSSIDRPSTPTHPTHPLQKSASIQPRTQRAKRSARCAMSSPIEFLHRLRRFTAQLPSAAPPPGGCVHTPQHSAIQRLLPQSVANCCCASEALMLDKDTIE